MRTRPCEKGVAMIKKLGVVLSLVLIAILVCTAAACAAPSGASSDFSATTSGSIRDNVSFAGDDGDNPGIINFIATFESNGGSPVPAQQTPVVQEEPATTRDGYRFAGWFLTPDFSDSRAVFPYALERNTTFYAKWLSNATQPVSTVEELIAIGKDEGTLSGNYALVNNIDLSSIEAWTAIGYKEALKFTGTFDGNGYTISNMTVKDLTEDEEFRYLGAGLFGYVQGSVSNVKISNYKITVPGDISKYYVGPVVGILMENGSVSNCHTVGVIDNPKLEYEGSWWDDIFGSYAEPTANSAFGGVVGRMEINTTLKNCSAQGSILSKSHAEELYIGGLVGYTLGSVSDSYASVTVEGGRYAGGLIGHNDGAVSATYATGSVTCALQYPVIAGGLVGYNASKGSVVRSYASGKVTGRTAGGFVGVNMFDYAVATGGRIEDCYSLGNVVAAEYGGGFAGRLESALPDKGSSDFSSLIDDEFYFVLRALAFGDVEVVVQNVYYEDADGTITESTGVYHPVFAGGFTAHASETRINGALAYGDVVAKSSRPVGSTGSEIYNPAYATNFIGQNSALTSVCRNIYALEDQLVLRNDEPYGADRFNSSPTVASAALNSADFYLGLGMNQQVWNLNNLNIAAGRYPTLYL